MTQANKPLKSKVSRRRLLQGSGVIATAAAMPWIWIPREVNATVGFGTVKHLIYIRLSGGFRFTTAFNCDLPAEFSPFGTADGVASGTEWGVGRLLAGNTWRTEELAGIGLRPVPQFTNEMAVLTCVDHEPLSGSADGNHQTGLERFLTGYVGGDVGLFTMINYGLREQTLADQAEGIIKLPAIIMGESGMGRGGGEFGAFRPPVLRGDDLDRFSSGATDALPEWARVLSEGRDARLAERVNQSHFSKIDSYIQSREATKAYAEIFASDALKIGENGQEPVDGMSNAEIAAVFDGNGNGSDAHLALRLFHYGCPAVYIDQGGYDFHSDEEMELPVRMEALNHLLSGLEFCLKRMDHPEGGKYWDHTVIALGSEFSRSARGAPFNSARGSDHGGDYATRFMSMPFMGGPIVAKGRRFGTTAAADMAPEGAVYSYRSMWKTMLDSLGCDHEVFFPADEPFDDLFT